MKLFRCGCCGQQVYFENVQCTRCGAKLGFLPDRLVLVALQAGATADAWQAVHQTGDYHECANGRQYDLCNWMVPAADNQPYCAACRLNHTIPDLNVVGNQALWRNLETEKRRLVYSLLRLGLPLVPHWSGQPPLSFAFLADSKTVFNERVKVFTGHDSGLITINIKEADPAERARARDQMDEPYRTLLGHFRHEAGHYYWDLLIRNHNEQLHQFRNLFGHEGSDYNQALQHYYNQGPVANWQEQYISAYATMHPWEDWAESWAHYLHMVDTMETAWQFNISLRSADANASGAKMHHDFDPYRADTMDVLIEHWLPLTFALNSLNRSMGHDHAYPFVISQTVVQKLAFIHQAIRCYTKQRTP